MNPADLLLRAKEAIVAFPEASLSLFFGGLAIGWAVSFMFAHRELKVNRIIIAELKEPNISQAVKDQLLNSALPQRRVGPWVRSLGGILMAAAVAAAVAWAIQTKAPIDSSRHLSDDKKISMAAKLQLDPNETYSVEFNSASNCDECEEFAEEIREFINKLNGWKATGGTTIFGSARERGIKIVVRTIDDKLKAATLIHDAFENAGIPTIWNYYEQQPGGTFTVLIARRER